jgi:DNA-binding NarL/FixJ family response regulator
MKVLLADDHSLFLEGLRNLLNLHGVQVVGTAQDGHEAVEKALQLHPDIVLMDIRMPCLDGVSATRLIKAERPECKVVMLTTSTEEADLLEAIKSGASGYLLKTLEAGPFLSYLRGVERGEAAISREMSSALIKEIANQDQEELASPDPEFPTDENLTPRQVEILQLVAQGLIYKEIAERLCISEHTVKYHMGEIMGRLHLKNREQVTAYALQTGLASQKR